MEADDREAKPQIVPESVSTSDQPQDDSRIKQINQPADNALPVASEPQHQAPKVMTIDLPMKQQPTEPQRSETSLESKLSLEPDPREIVDKQPEALIEPPNLDAIVLTETNPINTSKSTCISTDNGIFEFMSVDRAIELYKRIHDGGIPDLDWKFYGRRRPGDTEVTDVKDAKQDTNETAKKDDTQNQISNTEFDFDEEFGALPSDTSTIGEKLQLKKRPEPGSEKKTNLSDIMSDIMKESHTDL